jgi:hypothetical protein
MVAFGEEVLPKAPGVLLGQSVYCDTELFLGRKMAVKGRLGHVGFGNDLVDAGGAKALLVKEAQGGFNDALPGIFFDFRHGMNTNKTDLSGESVLQFFV